MDDIPMYLFFGFSVLIVGTFIYVAIWPMPKRKGLARWWPGHTKH